MEGLYILTPIGRMYLDGSEYSAAACEDMGVTMETIRIIGPYIVSTVQLQIVSDDILPAALHDCYISAHGYLVHCSHIGRVTANITRVFAVLRSRYRYVLCCDNFDKIELYIDRWFSVLRYTDIDVTTIDVLEIYNYDYLGCHDIILKPSPQFARHISACCKYCLYGCNGWVVIDAKECAAISRAHSRYISEIIGDFICTGVSRSESCLNQYTTLAVPRANL